MSRPLGIAAVDDRTITVTTASAEALPAERRQPVVPGAEACLGRARRRLRGERRHAGRLRRLHGRKLGKRKERQNQSPYVRTRTTRVPGRASLTVSRSTSRWARRRSVCRPFMAGELGMAYLNRVQIPFMEQRMGGQHPPQTRSLRCPISRSTSMRRPSMNVNVRRALALAVDREEDEPPRLAGRSCHPRRSILPWDTPGTIRPSWIRPCSTPAGGGF